MNTSITVTRLNDDVLVADSRDIAKGLGIEHHSFMSTIYRHIGVLETEFTGVRFEIDTLETKGGKQQCKFALLTDEQTAFIATLSRNTPNVVRFKASLVKAFSDARKALNNPIPTTKESISLPSEDVAVKRIKPTVQQLANNLETPNDVRRLALHLESWRSLMVKHRDLTRQLESVQSELNNLEV